jgi:hypothetical protein
MSKQDDKRRRAKYTPEFKLEAVRLVKGGQLGPSCASRPRASFADTPRCASLRLVRQRSEHPGRAKWTSWTRSIQSCRGSKQEKQSIEPAACDRSRHMTLLRPTVFSAIIDGPNRSSTPC